MLDALSRGDTQATVEVSHEHANDELARIAQAVNTFRTQTLALRRHRRRAFAASASRSGSSAAR